MKAVQVISPGRAEFVEAPRPALKPGHALVRSKLVSLCGSDVRMLYYAPDDEYPCAIGTTGHEMVGVVEAVDAVESGLKIGDVALTLAPYHRAMTEYFLAPVENVLVLPKGRPLEHLLMAQQLGTVIHACKRLPNVVGKTVVVIGQGSAGLFFDVMLRRMGAERVIGLDLKDARVAAGLRFGATHTLNNAQTDPIQAVTEITAGKLADVVIEAAGTAEAINLTPRLVAVGGQLLFFGIPHTRDVIFSYWELFRKYCHTTSAGAAMLFDPAHTSFRMALDLIERGEIDVSPLITHRLPFDRVMEAYELARTRDDGAIKVVIEMPGY
jgi:threonine dehydrogenase-like Zn-dependent dehydrogenase